MILQTTEEHLSDATCRSGCSNSGQRLAPLASHLRTVPSLRGPVRSLPIAQVAQQIVEREDVA